MDEENLRKYFLGKLKECKEKDQKYHDSLMGELLSWGTSVPIAGTLFNTIEDQINHESSRKNIPSKQFIDYLFSQNDYSKWMNAFQGA